MFTIALSVLVLVVLAAAWVVRDLRNDTFSPQGVLNLMHYAQRLKHEPRNGWSVAGRYVANAESVGSHTFGFGILTFMCARHLGFRPEELYSMLLVHDLVESVPGVGDIVVYHLTGEERRRAEVEKRCKEYEAIELIAEVLPRRDAAIMRRLWYEYDAGKTLRAQVAKQLDKLEAALQAIAYEAAGHASGADDYIKTTRERLTHPRLIEVLNLAVARRDSLRAG